MSDDFSQQSSMIARRLSMEESEYEDSSGGGGGGGATPIASNGNIFEVNSAITGPGEGNVEGLSKLLYVTLMAQDMKNFMEGGDMPTLSFLLGQINAGSMLIKIDLLSNAMNPQPMNLLSKKPGIPIINFGAGM